MDDPYGPSADISGNVYIADYYNNKIRKVDSACIISTFAGTGAYGSSGDGSAAKLAYLSFPCGVSADNSGNVYITDWGNTKIRMVNSAGIITTFAGTGAYGSSGDGGAATLAQFMYPTWVSADISGNVYITDWGNTKIRKVDSAGIITTFAGTGAYGSSGDGYAATLAQFMYPYGVSADISGNVYIADNANYKIRMVNSAGIITTFAGTGAYGSSGDGYAATFAQFIYPYQRFYLRQLHFLLINQQHDLPAPPPSQHSRWLRSRSTNNYPAYPIPSSRSVYVHYSTYLFPFSSTSLESRSVLFLPSQILNIDYTTVVAPNIPHFTRTFQLAVSECLKLETSAIW